MIIDGINYENYTCPVTMTKNGITYKNRVQIAQDNERLKSLSLKTSNSTPTPTTPTTRLASNAELANRYSSRFD